MKIEDIEKMSDFELKSKIAELCKWERKFLGYTDDNGQLGNSNCEEIYSSMPDYTNDLNAMHKVEKEIEKNGKFWNYYLNLQDIRGLGGNNHWKQFHATARQRAEAFVLTMEKTK